MTKKIIFDTDPGIDDAAALLLIDRHSDLELIGVTTIFGNADINTVTRNALWLRELMGFEAPIAAGPAMSLEGKAGPYPDFVHGADGFGGLAPESVSGEVDPRPAHQLISDLARQSTEKVTIVAVGCLTNVALALMHDPQLPIFIEEIIIMGGAFGGVKGNVSPVAEANIRCDPTAADIVFGGAWRVTAIGLDVTTQVVLSEASLKAIPKGDAAIEAIKAATYFYMNFYATEGVDGCYVHDASAVACAIAPEIFQCSEGAVRVVRDGMAAGQTIQAPMKMPYEAGEWSGRPSQRVARSVDADAVLKLLSNALGQLD